MDEVANVLVDAVAGVAVGELDDGNANVLEAGGHVSSDAKVYGVVAVAAAVGGENEPAAAVGGVLVDEHGAVGEHESSDERVGEDVTDRQHGTPAANAQGRSHCDTALENRMYMAPGTNRNQTFDGELEHRAVH